MFLLAGLAGVPSFLISNWKIILAVLGAGALAFFVYKWDNSIKVAAQLQMTNQILKDNATILEAEKEKLQDAMKEAAVTAAKNTQDATEVTSIITESKNAKVSDNGPVAPVLAHGLVRVGKLLANHGGKDAH